MSLPRNDISIVCIVKNEAYHLEKHLPTWKSICEDIVIVDTGSTDKSTDIALQFQCKLIHQPWIGYGPSKNAGITVAKNDWILSFDADEAPDKTLADAIATIKLKSEKAYQVNVLTAYGHQFVYHCGWHPLYLSRLFNRQDMYWNQAEVHEKLISSKKISVIKLPGKLLHYSYRDEEHQVQKLQKYANLRAEEWYKSNQKPSLWRRYFGPMGRFLTTYIFKLGILDGSLGFKICSNEAKMVRWQIEAFDKMNK